MLSCNSAYRLRYWNEPKVRVGIPNIGSCNSAYRLRHWNNNQEAITDNTFIVATVLTVYGIETILIAVMFYTNTFELQQYLPFTVLKRSSIEATDLSRMFCCNSTYRLRYWNYSALEFFCHLAYCRCNSTYRLRYWNFSSTSLHTGEWYRCNSTYCLRYWNAKVL